METTETDREREREMRDDIRVGRSYERESDSRVVVIGFRETWPKTRYT
jgi:hypothetical protein